MFLLLIPQNPSCWLLLPAKELFGDGQRTSDRRFRRRGVVDSRGGLAYDGCELHACAGTNATR
ncbi:MAG TPA: hypothetical protein PK537_00965 [Candidatus Limiplasma sp.]|nr:hypothetical protein [Candidatus Limiplasma sp.]